MMGVDVDDALIIKNSNLHNKKRSTRSPRSKAKMAQQVQDMQLRQQLQQQETVTNSLNAKAQSDQALAAERLIKSSSTQPSPQSVSPEQKKTAPAESST